MSLLFETILCQNRQLHLLDYHAFRMQKSLKDVLKIDKKIDLSTIEIPTEIGQGMYRCRVSYGEKIEKIDFFLYQFKHPKFIQLHEDDALLYAYKFEDRTCFQQVLDKYPTVDEVIITQKQHLTDATFANIALFDGSKWFTPNTYLLAGTKRQFLLNSEQIFEAEIKVKDLKKFKKIALINAMRNLEINYEFEVFKERVLIMRDMRY